MWNTLSCLSADRISGTRKPSLPLRSSLRRQAECRFHVAEDLITTLVTMFIAARTEPAFINSRLQLIFTDEFTMDANHFTPLYDRMGAWAPRRLSLDPWDTGVCRGCRPAAQKRGA